MKNQTHHRFRHSLRGKMLRQAIIPLVILAMLIGIVGTHSFTSAMLRQVKTQMQNQCHMVADLYDRVYPGKFQMEVLDEKTYNLYKGNVNITAATQLIDSMHDSSDVDISIFCEDICVVTTLQDDSGARKTLTKASAVLRTEVFDNDQEQFYSGVTLNGQTYFAYFIPIPHEDGEKSFGMYGIYRLASDVHALVWQSVLPLLILCIFATILIGLISVLYSQKIVSHLQRLQLYMQQLADSKFDAELPAQLLQLDDELGSLAKSSQRMQHALRLLIECDGMTGLYNRRSGGIRLQRAKKFAADYHANLFIALCDIDNLKKINDTYGHAAGDQLLKAVAQVFKRHMTGKQRCAVRWDGEEFLLIFENSTLVSVQKLVQEMHKQVSQLSLSYNNQTIHSSLSIALVQVEPTDSVDQLFHATNALLQFCKTNGKNQVQFSDLTKKKTNDEFSIL